ncbi:ComF family protein [Agromyces sp. Marseille-Q5079]|uniref:ComF family protein n=1 Tax=Agromyces sp. Marseille-Q5079 TaxID=3439059 RepID=UPI003D9C9C4A
MPGAPVFTPTAASPQGVACAASAGLVTRLGPGTLRRALRDAVATVLPVSCAGCGAPDRSVCAACRALATGRPTRLDRAGLAVWAALDYGGGVASLIGAFKDGGRTDAAPVLARALAGSLRAALGAAPRAPGDGLRVVTVPSTPAAHRSRGYRPVPLLLDACGIRADPILVLTRDRVDQAGLDAEARRVNAHGALQARERLDGRRFLLVDDVLTTGSTLLEARRAIRTAGGSVAAIAVLAQTPLRIDARSGSSR